MFVYADVNLAYLFYIFSEKATVVVEISKIILWIKQP